MPSAPRQPSNDADEGKGCFAPSRPLAKPRGGLHEGLAKLGRDPLLWVAVAAIIGILLADRLELSATWAGVCAALVIGGALVRPHGALVLSASAAGFAWLHTAHVARIDDFPLRTELQSGKTVPVEVIGMVLDAPRDPRFDSVAIAASRDEDEAVSGSLTLKLESLEVGGARYRLSHSIRVRLEPLPVASQLDGPIRYGDRLRLGGTLANLPEARNPGGFDPRRYFLRSAGALAELTSGPGDRFQRLAIRSGHPLRHFAEDSRRWLAAAICRDLEDQPEVAAILQAMTLGAREHTPDDVEELFRLSGSLHIFAVSGMHVGIFAAFVWGLLSLLRLPRRYLVLLVVPAVLFYSVVTGLRPSACRAAIMAAVILMGLLADRRARLLNSLGLAALILLAIDSQQIFLPGFQLSFAVLASIAVLANPIRRCLRRCWQLDPFVPRQLVPAWRLKIDSTWWAVTGLLAMSVAAWLGSAALVIWHFHLLTPIAVISNLLMVPLATLILGVACLSMTLTALLLPLLAVLANNLNWLLVKILAACAGIFAAIPGGHLSFAPSHADPGFSDASPASATDLDSSRRLCRLITLDAGGGGGAHLLVAESSGGQPSHWLIDTGSERVFGHVVEPALRALAVTRLDGIALTHGDLRHIGGVPLAIERFRPELLWQSALPNRSPARTAIEAAQEKWRLSSTLVGRDSTPLELRDSCQLRVLFPPADHPAASQADDQALVMALEAGPWRVLLMSDAGFATERWLLEHCPAAELRAQVVIMGRHRGDPSGGGAFLRRVEPLALVCTHADFPASERIPEDWRRELRTRGVALFDQAECGAVDLVVGRRFLRLDAVASDQTFLSRSR